MENATEESAVQAPNSIQLALESDTQPTLITEPRVVVPPDSFAVVETGVYRSSVPNPENFTHLRGLGLRSVVILSAERPGRDTLDFFRENNIKVLHTGRHEWAPKTSWKPISEEVVKESLELILREDTHPVLVCDVGGIHLVGMLVGCLRRLQHWNLNSVVDEYRAFAASNTRYANEQFIELYDIDLVTIPENPPTWFAEQLQIEREERDEFNDLSAQGRLDNYGTLLDREHEKQYRVFYYSSACPLNSKPELGAKPPRIRTL